MDSVKSSGHARAGSRSGKLELFDRPVFHIVLVVLLGLVAYSNTFGVPFQFDDYLVDITYVGNISGIPSLFTDIRGEFGSRPLLLATLGLNYYFGGVDTWGYHAVNLALHLANATLLYLLVTMTGRHCGYDRRVVRHAALFSAGLFVLHPVQTEAVTYIISRSVLLATTFYFAGMILFFKAVTAERRKGLFIAGLLVSSLLGMASRESFATFPLMLFLYDIFFVSRFQLRKAVKHWKAYVPVVLSLGYMAYMIANNTYVKSIAHSDIGIPSFNYFLSQFSVHWTYLRLLFLPVNMNAYYDYPIALTFFELRTILSFVGYIGLWAGALVLARKQKAIAFFVLWFLITLLPISFAITFTNLALDYMIAEHRLYLPGAGAIVAMASGGAFAMRRLKGRRLGAVILTVSVITTFLLAANVYKRNNVWLSDVSLWEDTLTKSPHKVEVHNNVGYAYNRSGQVDKAEERFLVALKINPNQSKAHNNLGLIYYNKGQFKNAKEHFLAAIEIEPSLAQAHNNLGNISLLMGDYGKAVERFEAALNINPRYAKAHNNLGVAYRAMGQFDIALEHFRIALELNPNSALAHNNLGMSYQMMGLNDKAEEHFRQAQRLGKGE